MALRKDSRPLCFSLHGGLGGHAKEPRDSGVLSAPLSGGKGEEAHVDGLPAEATDHSQCNAEERDAVAGGGQSTDLIFKTVADPILFSGVDLL